MSMIATVLWWIVLGMLLGWMGSWVFNRTLRTRVPATGGPVVAPRVEVPVERVVERRVEVPVDRVVERVVEVPVERIVEMPVERVVERVVQVPVERVVPDAGAIAARDATIRALGARVVHLEALSDVLSARVVAAAPGAAPGPSVPSVPSAPSTPAAPSGIDLAAAVAAGYAPRGVDDLEIVEGIGPRIAALLRAEGIATWRALAACGPLRLRDVLDLGGPGFRIADPASWPEQAALAADGRWAELRALQDRLVAGRR